MTVTTIQTKSGPRKVASLRGCINRFCRECIYDQAGGTGTWRQQVEACTSYKCPLYQVRPISATQDGGPVGEDEDTYDLPLEGQDGAESARFMGLQALVEDTE